MSTVYAMWDPVALIVVYFISCYVFITMVKNQKEYKLDSLKYLANSEDPQLSMKLVKAPAMMVGGAISLLACLFTGYYGFITVFAYLITAFLYDAIDKFKGLE